jgi:hypothetical protein
VMVRGGLLWAVVAVAIIGGCVVALEWLYRRRHPYVVGLRPFSARRYANYAWGRLRRFPAEAARSTAPFRPWGPLLLQKPRLVRFFRRWNMLRKKPGFALEIGIPWLAFEAIEWLDRHLDPAMRAFEWGSGGSTLYLARRVGTLVAIEHNATWYERVSRRLESEGIENCEYLLYEPGVKTESDGSSSVPGGYSSADPRLATLSFKDYCAAIDAHADESFDLVVVDGRARVSCIFHARNKVRLGGVMVVDNSERKDYAPGLELLAGWPRRDFAGPAAFYAGFSTTTIFMRQAMYRP